MKNQNILDINKQFHQAFNILENSNKNLFLTGKAGTGKSTFLQYFIANTKKTYIILAPTGVAALNVDGETIHSFFKFMPNITRKEVLAKAGRIKDNSLHSKIEIIIIDEISMVRADLMDFMDIYLRKVLKKRTPFGGKQVLFIGDLYQLPPVVTSREKDFFQEKYASPYFFDAEVIKNPKFRMEFIELEKIYRQKDRKFIKVLNAARNKTVQEEDFQLLNSRIDPSFEDKDYITLTPTNDLADRINTRELNKIKAKSKIYIADITGNFKANSYPTEIRLKLKPGTRIMFLNNDSSGRWVNGTMGTVRKLSNNGIEVENDFGDKFQVAPHTWSVKQSVYDRKAGQLKKETIGSFTQIPVRLAWAVTIHKSQGKTFEKVIIDLGRGSFAHGQTYVALSRCTDLSGMILKKEIKKSHLLIDYRVVKFLTSYQYELAEKVLSTDEKIKILENAKQNDLPVEIVYLKAQDVKSKRKIKINSIGEEEYMGVRFLAVCAYCMKRKEDRVFRIDRILSLRVCE